MQKPTRNRDGREIVGSDSRLPYPEFSVICRILFGSERTERKHDNLPGNRINRLTRGDDSAIVTQPLIRHIREKANRKEINTPPSSFEKLDIKLKIA